nr:MAG TPA: hypothetical protein [Bacteriophage sp.]
MLFFRLASSVSILACSHSHAGRTFHAHGLRK